MGNVDNRLDSERAADLMDGVMHLTKDSKLQ